MYDKKTTNKKGYTATSPLVETNSYWFYSLGLIIILSGHLIYNPSILHKKIKMLEAKQ